MFKWLAPFLLFLLVSLSPAHADSLVVQTCGTLPLAYAPGSTRLDTVDVNGVKCAGGGTAASPTFSLVCDAAVPATCANVKAASTAALATDKSLVVQINPNSPASRTLQCDTTVQTQCQNVAAAGGVNYAMSGIVDNTGTQLNGYTTGTLGTTSPQYLSVQNADPCFASAKSSAAISVASATTTSLVAVSGSTVVYVCGFSMTIAPSATAADTAAFEYGTGAACTGPTLLTGTFGNGDLTSAAPVVPISYGDGGHTIFKSAASAGICILTAGTAVSVQGVLTYVQQ